MKQKLPVVILLTIFAPVLQAQEKEPVDIQWWIDPGMGTYTTFNGREINNITFILGGLVQKNKSLYKLRYMRNYEFEIFSPVSPTEYYNSFHFLLGRKVSDSDLSQIHLLTGIGVTSGLKRNELIAGSSWLSFNEDYESEQFVTPSIPLEVEFMFKPLKYVGFGATVFLELNLKQPLIGLAGKAMLGKVK